jgi:hypothetical protein
MSRIVVRILDVKWCCDICTKCTEIKYQQRHIKAFSFLRLHSKRTTKFMNHKTIYKLIYTEFNVQSD